MHESELVNIESLLNKVERLREAEPYLQVQPF